ncbi:hypothetical protein SAMN02745164_01873 [Marinitoga hydrogenitolerans DSM 16785]|uniref:DUF4203 domain-containing protein n=1 Tax=Marinitoga hydrogenitolerans (strain DSM 16785 / JCM 12826 / AT1271) TaxID=1122195 RepID=A0A1M4Z8T2_MARH1|nr:hypothetical protein [Marinitoga hydrogenitolerans]SHF14430.1 hypothetical protein SAMN02745164_01873 [Marinitoga hydrogenitolerans DSM 16785]
MEETIASTISNIIQQNSDSLKVLYSYSDSWYIILPISLISTLFAKKVSKIIFFILGFLSSYVFIIPYISKFDYTQELLKQINVSQDIIYLIFSVIIGILTYSLFKSSVQIAGFILGGIIGFEISGIILKFYPEIFNTVEILKKVDQLYIPWIFAVIIGLIVSVLITKSFDNIVTILTILIASTIAAFFSVFVLENSLLLKIGENTLLEHNINISDVELITILVFSVIYIILGFSINFKKSTK